ncbi:MAG: hypothetical protein ACREXU_10275 [Gammaproteobacteria bacterium]
MRPTKEQKIDLSVTFPWCLFSPGHADALSEAQALRERLIDYAADTKDHTVSDTFVQLLRSRRSD